MNLQKKKEIDKHYIRIHDRRVNEQNGGIDFGSRPRDRAKLLKYLMRSHQLL